MDFEQALKQGDLDIARVVLEELAELPDTGGLWMPECYADLAREYDRQGRHDDAISLHERAIELGWNSTPDARSDIAEFHLRAGRQDQAAAIWAELKASDPDDVWHYNAAGLSYNEVRQHDLAIRGWPKGSSLGCARTTRRESLTSSPPSAARVSVPSAVTSTAWSSASIRSWKSGGRRSKRAALGSRASSSPRTQFP
jgi:hypothetical protein